MKRRNLFILLCVLVHCIGLVCFGLASCESETETGGKASVFVRNDSSERLVSLRLFGGEDETSNDNGLGPGESLTLTIQSKYDLPPYYNGKVWKLTVRTSSANTFSKEMRLIDGMTRRFSFTGTEFKYIQ